ncbi:exodeoxyribonuclease VII large subunit [Candidatus Neomarinimicrobiota bacterium]
MIDTNIALTVSDLTSEIKNILESNFPELFVQGEISNFMHHNSGHMYFTLKDDKAEIRCAMFKGNNQFLHFKPEGGMHVFVNGRISVYEQRGAYQLIVKQMEPAGYGTLYLALEALKKQLQSEGLFDEDRKLVLPQFPNTVGIITSETGAVFQDIHQILERRAPFVELVLRPTLVQGDLAADDIVKALDDLQRIQAIDVIILGRGGGSIEDLWPFNEEKVARAISDCTIPIISAVGHETDFTIADYVCDLRAATPSAAAEIVISSKSEIQSDLNNLLQRIAHRIEFFLEQRWQNYDQVSARLISQRPDKKIQRWNSDLDFNIKRLKRATNHIYSENLSRLTVVRGKLESLDPKSILNRGYSIAYQLPERQIIRTQDDIINGEEFELQTGSGSIFAEKIMNKKATDNG